MKLHIAFQRFLPGDKAQVILIWGLSEIECKIRGSAIPEPIVTSSDDVTSRYLFLRLRKLMSNHITSSLC
jgi:hypothetical protein